MLEAPRQCRILCSFVHKLWLNRLMRRFYWSVSSKWLECYWTLCTVGWPCKTTTKKKPTKHKAKESKGLFTRREGYPCARLTLASRLKLALVYKQTSQGGLPYHLGQLYQLCWRVSSCVTFFATSTISNKTWSSPMENTLKSRKNGYVIIVYRKYLMLFRCL